MINKLYVKGKDFLNKNYKLLCILSILFVLFTMPLPYYIDAPGGAIDIKKKFTLEEAYQSKGSFHFAYVTEMKATPLTYLYSFFKKDWEVLKKEDIKYDNETIINMNFRDRMLMKESYNNAILVAFHKAHKKVEIKEEHLYVTYIASNAETTLENGDEILSFEGKKVSSKKELLTFIRAKKEGEKVSLRVRKDNKEYVRTAEIILENQTPVIGIMVSVDQKLETDPTIELHTKKTESGPSGGLMLSLAIYDALTKEDLTSGLKIVGTGTIDEEGNVGEIGGVSFKLKGAVKERADVFLVPAGKNYKEAMQLKKERGYTIEIKAISTFDEALTYLKKK